MINRRLLTCIFIFLSLLLVLMSCHNAPNPPKEEEKALSYVQDGDTFTFTGGSPRYMVRYNSSSNKEIPLSDTGYIKSYSSSDEIRALGYTDSVVRLPRSLSEEPLTEENEGEKITLSDFDYKIGKEKEFYIWDSNELGQEDSFRKANMILRVEGEHCLIWCEEGLVVSDELLTKLQESFDRVYPLETALFGTCSDYTVKDTEQYIIEANDKIYINIVSLKNPTVGGCFNTVDMYKASYIEKINKKYDLHYETNEARMFCINYSAEPSFVNDMDGCISVLIHEFQHMLRFICDNIVKGIDTNEWYNEMMSLLSEDIFSGYLGLKIDSTAITRLEFFKLFTNWGVSCWNISDFFLWQASYSVSYAFGSYLLRNYGGADFLAALTDFNTAGTGKEVINNAFIKLGLKNKEEEPLSFDDVAADFHQICIYTSKEDADKGHLSLNREVTFDVEGTTITAPAINLLEDKNVMPFPYSDVITSEQYSRNLLYPYGFILSDLSTDQIGEEPITDAKEIVMVLPKDDDVKIYFY